MWLWFTFSLMTIDRIAMINSWLVQKTGQNASRWMYNCDDYLMKTQCFWFSRCIFVCYCRIKAGNELNGSSTRWALNGVQISHGVSLKQCHYSDYIYGGLLFGWYPFVIRRGNVELSLIFARRGLRNRYQLHQIISLAYTQMWSNRFTVQNFSSDSWTAL